MFSLRKGLFADSTFLKQESPGFFAFFLRAARKSKPGLRELPAPPGCRVVAMAWLQAKVTVTEGFNKTFLTLHP